MKVVSFAGWGVLALLVTCWGQQARAELPPSAYPDPRDAPDVVDVKVLSVRKTYRLFSSSFNVSRYKVEVIGRVMAIHRTATGLKPGSKITIHYDAHSYNRLGWCGPGSFPILDKGGVYRAHLTAGEMWNGVYTPRGAPYNAFEERSEKQDTPNQVP